LTYCCIITGDTVFIQGAAATPLELVKEMTNYGKTSGLKDVTVCHMHTEGVAGYTEPEFEGKQKLTSLLRVQRSEFLLSEREVLVSSDDV
jgi:hypothetical protein